MMTRPYCRRRDLIAGSFAVLLLPGALGAKTRSGFHRVAIVARPGLEKGQATSGELRAWDAWNAELAQLGYVDGENLLIERHEVEPSGVADLVASLKTDPPDAIFAPSQNIVVLLKEASIPIPVVTVVVNPVGYGLAESLARPGGMITGFSLSSGKETTEKRIALLKEAAPGMSKLAVLILRPYWEGIWGPIFTEAARKVGASTIGATFEAGATEADYRAIFTKIVAENADALAITPALETVVHRQLIADLAISAGIPNISLYRENVEAGGLISYGPDLADIYRRSAGYIDRILKGADPAEMPFQQPTKFDLSLNLKTANALGLKLPPTLLAIADEVFE